MRAARTNNQKSWWRKNGILDIFTSVTCIVFALVLIWSLSMVAFSASLTLSGYLIWYYFFLFSCSRSATESWTGIGRECWKA